LGHLHGTVGRVVAVAGEERGVSHPEQACSALPEGLCEEDCQ